MTLNSPLVRGDSLSEQAVQRVAVAILSGELAPGAKIKEAEIARRLGVSRGPLREAMGRLEARRLIKRDGSNLKVVQLSYEDLNELFMVREVLEGMACRLAATTMSDVELEELGGLLGRHVSSVERQEGGAYHHGTDDEDFHFRIVHGSQNKLLIRLLCNELYYLLRFYRYHSTTRPGRAKDSLDEHREIVEALRGRDGDRAEAAMRRHISFARQNLVWLTSKE